MVNGIWDTERTPVFDNRIINDDDTSYLQQKHHKYDSATEDARGEVLPR